jgi:hypothetical protein
MNVEHHDLVHEFPEHREKIHDIKNESCTFLQSCLMSTT